MHQTDLHLLGTVPPMPPPPLLQSLPEPPLIPGCGRRAYVAGGKGLHAPLEQHGNVQPRQRGQRKSARASSTTPQDSMHACAPCTHSNAFSKTTSHAGHAVQSKQCIGHRPTLSCKVLASSWPLHFCAGSAHTHKDERMAASVTSLPQFGGR
jgi:hypothetical protein